MVTSLNTVDVKINWRKASIPMVPVLLNHNRSRIQRLEAYERFPLRSKT